MPRAAVTATTPVANSKASPKDAPTLAFTYLAFSGR